MTPLAFLKALALGALIILLLCLARGSWMVGQASIDTLKHVSLAADSISAAPAMLTTVIDRLPSQILPPVLARVDTAVGKLDAQLTGARGDIAAGIDAGLHSADGMIADLQPVLLNAASIEAHADKTIVDLHPQLLGLVAASKVTMGQTALTMREVERATPALLQDVEGIAGSFDGIAADVHTETTEFVKPRTGWQRFKLWLETAGKIGARFL